MPSSNWLSPVIQHRVPMRPQPTNIAPRLHRLPDVRAVIFDVYGTLLISGSGDVGTSDVSASNRQIVELMSEVGLDSDPELVPATADLQAQILSMNGSIQSNDNPHPEVDIVEAWRRTLAERRQQSGQSQLESVEFLVRLTSRYEAIMNPTWPMPGAKELLPRLGAAGHRLGIVSNAQIFTIPLLEDLIEQRSLEAGGFDLDLCIFSNRFRQAKPGPRLFDVLRAALRSKGIEPSEAVYVGNDMLNDVCAASRAGLKTAWFVGDMRSCRSRDDDPRCRSVKPDLIIDDLMQLSECLELQ